MSGQGEKDNRKVSKHEALAAEYAKPGSQGDTEPNYRDFGRITGKSASLLIVDDIVSEHDGTVAQGSSARHWYNIAHALAEKEVPGDGASFVGLDRTRSRRNEETQVSGKVVNVFYTNWRGEGRYRNILPHSETLRFGTNEWHKEPQWLFKATCLESQTIKEFSMEGVSEWQVASDADQVLPWRTGEPPPTSVPKAGSVVTDAQGFHGVAVKPEPAPMDFPDIGKGDKNDTMNVTIVRGGTYYVTEEQARKFAREFRRLGIKTIPIEEKPK